MPFSIMKCKLCFSVIKKKSYYKTKYTYGNSNSFISEVFRKVLISTIVRWAEESQIETPKLVREMFRYVVISVL